MSIFKNAKLPWSLLGVVVALFILAKVVPSSDCPDGGVRYFQSPQQGHVAKHYYHGCGGATVGFSEYVEIDGHVVFSTYHGNKNMTPVWVDENHLRIDFINQQTEITHFESGYNNVEISVYQGSSKIDPKLSQ